MDRDKSTIKPEKITTPIQLLGAWLAGLISIDTCFLVAASNMDQGSWESAALIIAAIFNVPIFIWAIFLLQTKYRPELQEDSYYSTYLNQKTNEVVKVTREEAVLVSLQKKVDLIEKEISSHQVQIMSEPVESAFENLTVGINYHLNNVGEIQAVLNKEGVLYLKSFGGEEAPYDLKVAISDHLPKSVIRKILSLAKTLNFEFYGFYESSEDEIYEDVLFGAYGDKSKFKIGIEA
jgi:hypothetical protein